MEIMSCSSGMYSNILPRNSILRVLPISLPVADWALFVSIVNGHTPAPQPWVCLWTMETKTAQSATGREISNTLKIEFSRGGGMSGVSNEEGWMSPASIPTSERGQTSRRRAVEGCYCSNITTYTKYSPWPNTRNKTKTTLFDCYLPIVYLHYDNQL